MQFPSILRRAPSRWLPLIAALWLAGCAAVAELPPAPGAPAQFKEAAASRTDAGPALPANDEWWRAFGDPVLDDLVARAASANTGLRQAAARLAQARALARTVDADRAPQLGLDAGANRGRGLDRVQG
ncbi:MAG: RND transporter, partial [Comamonadaceae bacterium]